MTCPKCGSGDTGVTNTRIETYACTRRRECNKCGHKFTTYEITKEQYQLACSLFSGIDTLHDMSGVWRPKIKRGRYG